MGCRYLGLVAAAIACFPLSGLRAEPGDGAPAKESESSAAVSFRHDVIALAVHEKGTTDFATGSVFEFRNAHYLVTARHFAREREMRMVAVFSRDSTHGMRVPVENLKSEGSQWTHFSDVDLSVLKVRQDHELVKTVTGRHLPEVTEDSGLTTLSPVTLIGVPLLYGVSENTGVSPTVIRTSVANASVRLSKADPPVHLYLFPVDLPAGFSGGVVVDAKASPNQILRGVIIRNTVDEKGGQFSIAVPSEVLARLLLVP